MWPPNSILKSAVSDKIPFNFPSSEIEAGFNSNLFTSKKIFSNTKVSPDLIGRIGTSIKNPFLFSANLANE